MSKKIAILLWLYHQDLWYEFYNKLLPIKDDIFLDLALCDINFQDSTSIVNQATESFNNLNINYYPNMGGDILPFINQVSSLSNSFEIFLKLHSKKSSLFKNMNWRFVLLESYIGSEYQFKNNIAQFNIEDTGMVSNKSLLIKDNENTNSDKIKYLCDIFDINYNKYGKGTFSAGSMFFGKVELFQKYFNQENLPFFTEILKDEQGKVCDIKEGKYCHSIERIFGYLVKANNMKIRPCIQSAVKILNSLAPNKKLHIIRLYNNECYAEEDIHVYGHILEETLVTITIKWFHLKNPVVRKYRKINHNTLTRWNNVEM